MFLISNVDVYLVRKNPRASEVLHLFPQKLCLVKSEPKCPGDALTLRHDIPLTLIFFVVAWLRVDPSDTWRILLPGVLISFGQRDSRRQD